MGFWNLGSKSFHLWFVGLMSGSTGMLEINVAIGKLTGVRRNTSNVQPLVMSTCSTSDCNGSNKHKKVCCTINNTSSHVVPDVDYLGAKNSRDEDRNE
ncbi:hypothetical protein RND71_024080 [Anisodus tanguticus]|uniref:Uncharacterized protein n=1 Tax=Anisodus tanguticus TaxID=243964 RepID=A0AAE1RMF7_9SOLA|nr:hypothetical protein RND71_024080 [Anisodus tanguticus]